MNFGDKIKTLRKEKNWKQEELANEIGTDSRQVSLYENGKCLPSVETIVKIAQVFNVSIDFLLIDNSLRRPLILSNENIYESINKVDLLSLDEKESIFKIIDGLAYKNKLKKVLAEVE